MMKSMLERFERFSVYFVVAVVVVRVDYTEILWSYFGFLVLSRFLLAAKKDTHMKKATYSWFQITRHSLYLSSYGNTGPSQSKKLKRNYDAVVSETLKSSISALEGRDPLISGLVSKPGNSCSTTRVISVSPSFRTPALEAGRRPKMPFEVGSKKRTRCSVQSG